MAGRQKECSSKLCFNGGKCSFGYFIRQQWHGAWQSSFPQPDPSPDHYFSPISPWNSPIFLLVFFGLVSDSLLCQSDTKQTWQGKESASYSASVYLCITGKKMLVYYPATGLKRIYPQVLNLLFPKLSGENKCLHLVTWTSISISLQFGQKSAIVYRLFVPNFKTFLLTGFAFQLGTEKRVEEDFD